MRTRGTETIFQIRDLSQRGWKGLSGEEGNECLLVGSTCGKTLPQAGKDQLNSEQPDAPIHTHFHLAGTKGILITSLGGSPVYGLLLTCEAEEPQEGAMVGSHDMLAACSPGSWSNNGFPLSSQAQ